MNGKEKEPASEATAKKGSSCLVFGLIGCAITGLIGLAVVCGGAMWGFNLGMQKVNEYAAPFEEKGYRRVAGQVIQETSRVEESKVYTAQVVTLRDGAAADIAIMAQVAEIHGTVEGDIDFFGQVLEIKDDAVIRGDIRVEAAQVIKVRGVVEGEITGSYQALDARDAPEAVAGSSADDPRSDQTSDEPASDDQVSETAEPAAAASDELESSSSSAP